MAARSGQVIIKSLIDGVPNLYTAHFLLVFFVFFTTWVFNLRRDWSNGKTAINWPFYGIALAFGKFYLFCHLHESNLPAYWLLYLLVVNDFGSLFVEVGDGISLLTPIFLVNCDYESAVIAHAEIFQLLLLSSLIWWDFESPNFHWAVSRACHQKITDRWKFSKLYSSIFAYFELTEVLWAILLASSWDLLEVQFPAEDLSCACACNHNTSWAARHSIKLLVSRARPVIIRSQGHIENENFVTSFCIPGILASLLRVSRSSAAASDSHFIIVVALRTWVFLTLSSLYDSAEGWKVIQVNSAVVRAS